MKRYVQINIGADTPSTPFSIGWVSSAFLGAVTRALEESTRGPFPRIETHHGVGQWLGHYEHSAHISTVADVDTYALRVKLAEIKKTFNQDAIALIVGSDLI